MGKIILSVVDKDNLNLVGMIGDEDGEIIHFDTTHEAIHFWDSHKCKFELAETATIKAESLKNDIEEELPILKPVRDLFSVPCYG